MKPNKFLDSIKKFYRMSIIKNKIQICLHTDYKSNFFIIRLRSIKIMPRPGLALPKLTKNSKPRSSISLLNSGNDPVNPFVFSKH